MEKNCVKLRILGHRVFTYQECLYTPARKLRVGWYDEDGYFPCTPGCKRAVKYCMSKKSGTFLNHAWYTWLFWHTVSNNIFSHNKSCVLSTIKIFFFTLDLILVLTILDLYPGTDDKTCPCHWKACLHLDFLSLNLKLMHKCLIVQISGREAESGWPYRCWMV